MEENRTEDSAIIQEVGFVDSQTDGIREVIQEILGDRMVEKIVITISAYDAIVVEITELVPLSNGKGCSSSLDKDGLLNLLTEIKRYNLVRIPISDPDQQ